MGQDQGKYKSEKKRSWEIFDRIHEKYDLLNRILSFGMDTRWRKKLSQLAGDRDRAVLLDLATGTGDVLFSLVRRDTGFKLAVGMDMSGKMIERARSKSRMKGLEESIDFLQGNAMSIPVKNEKIDLVTMAFGIRNIPDPLMTLKDIFRVLVRGGRALILEFSLPRNPLIKGFHIFYLRYCLPLIGKIISGDPAAYRYLNQTIETFPYGEQFIQLMENAGFSDCRRFELSLGAVTVYCGVKINE